MKQEGRVASFCPLHLVPTVCWHILSSPAWACKGSSLESGCFRGAVFRWDAMSGYLFYSLKNRGSTHSNLEMGQTALLACLL